MIEVRVTAARIGASDAEGLAASSDGAQVTFMGVVRDSTDERQVSNLHYEAYAEMAESELRKIAHAATEKWPISSVLVVHRTGSLEVGEVSVVVSVTAPHRGEAFDACEYVIDILKKQVPIWKKETFVDGSSSWVNHP